MLTLKWFMNTKKSILRWKCVTSNWRRAKNKLRLILKTFHSHPQITDGELSNLQTQLTNNNVTRLKDDIDTSLRISTITESSNLIELPRRKADAFSTWSSWSECDRRCKQKRTRKCVSRRKCGSVKQTEERNCLDDELWVIRLYFISALWKEMKIINFNVHS